MEKMKLKKLYDGDNDIRGYEFNNKYLLKHYAWGNYIFDWIIADKDYYSITSCEFNKLLDNENVKFVDSFKEGKEILLGK